jgi:selenium-binding protein 1
MISKYSSRRYFLVWVAVIALLILAAVPASAEGFVQGIVINIDGEDYYWQGLPVPDGPPGATDIPGHYWVQAGPNQLVGKHYNSGPQPNFWSSDAPDGELLYIAHVIIDEWTREKAEQYDARGYTHYHEFVSVADGSHHPTKVGWFKHTAVTSFTLNGGPAPQFYHEVTPGVDFEFIPNGMTPYDPE